MPYRDVEGGLGPLRSTHRWRLTPTLAFVGAALVGIAFVLVAVSVEPWTWPGALALAFFGVGAFGIALWTGRNRVELYERGFHHRWAGRETRATYDAITSIAKDVTPSGAHVVVRHSEGELVITHGLERIEALIRELETRSFQARIAHAEAQVEDGGARFGEIRLDRRLLTVEGSKLAVSMLRRIELHEHLGEAKVSIHTRTEARWRTLRDVEVHDADVLAVLVDRLAAASGREERSSEQKS